MHCTFAQMRLASRTSPSMINIMIHIEKYLKRSHKNTDVVVLRLNSYLTALGESLEFKNDYFKQG